MNDRVWVLEIDELWEDLPHEKLHDWDKLIHFSNSLGCSLTSAAIFDRRRDEKQKEVKKKKKKG